LSSAITFNQNINWARSKSWILYDIHDDNAFSYSIDTLKNFRSINLADSIIQFYLKDLKLWSKKESPLWMGLYVVTCILEDGSIHKLDLSVYGGFFYDEITKSYFSISQTKMDQWLIYLHDCKSQISSIN
jgi:hypothetical protein